MHRESSARVAESAPSIAGRRRPLFLLALCCATLAAILPAQAERRCSTPATARRHLHRKLCVKAHVYREIKLDDGTRILDICSPRTASADCRFAFVSLNRNRDAVGSLQAYVGKEIQVRGEVLPVHDRAEILLTRSKQLEIAQPARRHKSLAQVRRSKFHPNPQLLKGFNATQSRMPIADPAFRGGYRN